MLSRAGLEPTVLETRLCEGGHEVGRTDATAEVWGQWEAWTQQARDLVLYCAAQLASQRVPKARAG